MSTVSVLPVSINVTPTAPRDRRPRVCDYAGPQDANVVVVTLTAGAILSPTAEYGVLTLRPGQRLDWILEDLVDAIPLSTRRLVVVELPSSNMAGELAVLVANALHQLASGVPTLRGRVNPQEARVAARRLMLARHAPQVVQYKMKKMSPSERLNILRRLAQVDTHPNVDGATLITV
jgi:hypothetical protein